MNRDVVENTADLCTYVNKVTEELHELQSYGGYNISEAFTIVSLACQMYTADHMNRNMNANMNIGGADE